MNVICCPLVREPTFLILSALASGPCHGYGVIQAVEEISGGRVRLRAGTLYAALDRLVYDGLLQVDGEEVVGGRNRRYYAITAGGRQELRVQVDRMESNAAAARDRLGLEPA
jgi:PadR family transcriptional regulator, regulatory protein PadR